MTTVLRAKGFPMLWARWITLLNNNAHSTIFLNRRTGPWFPCKCGLRQGDSLSPYLFLVIVDVPQRMIIQDSETGLLSHHLDDTLPCPVLQYAHDTLIVLPAIAEQLHHLKQLLLQFSKATGLTIKFHKSTYSPIPRKGFRPGLYIKQPPEP